MSTKLYSSLLILILCLGSYAGATNKECKTLLVGESAAHAVVDEKAWIEEFKSEWKRQGSQFSKKQQKLWSEAMEHLTEDLEAMGTSSSNKDRLVYEKLRIAVRKLPEIQKAWLTLEDEDKKARYFKDTFVSVWAALTVHTHEIVDAKSKKTDFKRYFAIIDAINEFDPDKARFSFYKIRRTITLRFSMSEFINCR